MAVYTTSRAFKIDFAISFLPHFPQNITNNRIINYCNIVIDVSQKAKLHANHFCCWKDETKA